MPHSEKLRTYANFPKNILTAKRLQETNSLNRIGDSFKKIVVVKDDIIPWHDEKGVLYVGIEQFLLDESAMDL